MAVNNLGWAFQIQAMIVMSKENIKASLVSIYLSEENKQIKSCQNSKSSFIMFI